MNRNPSAWQTSELESELQQLSASLPAPLAPGYRGELCTRLGAWIAGLADTLESGAIMLFDYGLGRGELYHPQRDAGTLRCHYRHRAHDDPFWHPGLQDITAWVDFTRLAEAAAAAGLNVAGYCTQAAFLLGAGIDAELARAGDALERAQRASEARQLLLPGEMGETFKAMLLTRGGAAAATGACALAAFSGACAGCSRARVMRRRYSARSAARRRSCRSAAISGPRRVASSAASSCTAAVARRAAASRAAH